MGDWYCIPYHAKMLPTSLWAYISQKLPFGSRHWPEDGLLKSRSGTPVFMAPEVIMQEYGALCDEWSVGKL